MFEKAHPVSSPSSAAAGALPGEDRAGAGRSVGHPVRNDPRHLRRAGDALRAVEWSEITARLNAARDLRMLLRHESQAMIESVTASFGDAAASYFALLDNQGEGDVNPDALEQSKPLDAMVVRNDGPDQAAGDAAGKNRALREKNND